MFVAYQDLMIRWYRMRGRAALWVPGTDHAAIATQAVIERDLRHEGTSRHEIGREGFERRFWQWRDTYGSRITQQLRRLGASADWTRERFTMDDQLSHAVREAFVRLYEKGLIYRGEYLVNWCPEDRSAISDLEVEHETVSGQLWHIRYPLKDGGHLIVATTRPETMLGDTAVAVHPDDERYRDVVGRVAMVPGLGREIPVIAVSGVDREFGTGAVKITPGHDPNDWRMGQRHQLPVISILNDDGSLNDEAGQWAGMDRFEARGAYVAYLEGEGLLDRVEPHTHALGHCQRDGSVVEPRVSLQWFVNARPLADRAAQAVHDGTLTFHPRRAADEFLRWMEMIQPWCISRQLWLGHRIPVWYCGGCGETLVARTDPVRCSECGGHDLAQDPDVLDTWFSSGLWPFSTLGWPDETPDFKRFYPTDVLETGIDIIFFWVARMVMLGLELTDRLPFHTVYFNGMVRHADGSKIEKSNYQPGDDPAEVIEPYGADAFRFMMVTSTSEGADLRINLKRIEAAAHFANKAVERREVRDRRDATHGCDRRHGCPNHRRRMDHGTAGCAARRRRAPRGELSVRRSRPPPARLSLVRVLRLVRRGRQDSPLCGHPGRRASGSRDAGPCAGRQLAIAASVHAVLDRRDLAPLPRRRRCARRARMAHRDAHRRASAAWQRPGGAAGSRPHHDRAGDSQRPA